MPTFSVENIRQAIADVFVACGVPAEPASLVTDHLIEAELSGVVSHGLIRLPTYIDFVETGKVKPDAKVSIKSDGTSTAVVDGGGGFGPGVAARAMQIAVDKASTQGLGAVTLTNASHTGRLASYTLSAARQGMVGLAMVNAGGGAQWVAPYGGSDRRLSTNPMSIAVPSHTDDPIFIDFATSAAPEGKIRAMKTAGREIPEGWLRDERGQITTDPNDLYVGRGGALQPFGAHKGFGLALIVDLLAGALSQTGTCTDTDAPEQVVSDGAFLLAIRVDSFCPRDTFNGFAKRLVEYIKASPPAPGFEEVLISGELEARCKRQRLQHGIPIDEKTWGVIREPLERYGVNIQPS